MRLTSPLNLPAPGRRQWLYGDSSSWQPPVFLLNSRLGRFSAAGLGLRARSPLTYHRHPFSRSYGVMLPSSFSTDHSSTLGFSPRLPVSDCGTVNVCLHLRRFSRQCALNPFAEPEGPFGIGSRLSRSFVPWKRLPPCIGIHHPTDRSLLRPSSGSNEQTLVREY